MTLVIAFKCKGRDGNDGIVIASDPQVTYDGIASRKQKIVPITLHEENLETPLAIVGGAGDLAIIHKAVRIIKKVFSNECSQNWQNRRPSSSQFEDAVGKVEEKLVMTLASYREMGIKTRLSLILGGVDPEGQVLLYHLNSRGLSYPVHDSPGYVCIGSGFVTGGNLLLQQFFSPELDILKGTCLAAYIINQVSKIDTSVGLWEGESWLFDHLGMVSLLDDLDAVTRYQEDILKREDVLRKTWLLIDKIGPFEFEKILEKEIIPKLKRKE